MHRKINSLLELFMTCSLNEKRCSLRVAVTRRKTTLCLLKCRFTIKIMQPNVPTSPGKSDYCNVNFPVVCLVATIHFSPFTCCFRKFLVLHSRAFSATRTPNSLNYSQVRYSLSTFTGEWFTNHANHIHIFTPITGIVATKVAR